MQIEVVHTGGLYAERVLARLRAVAPDDVTAYQVPKALPPIIDEPEEFLPASLGTGELIITLDIHPDLLLEIPARVGGTVRGLLAPIEDPSWVRPGLQRQVTRACAERGLESAFPKPFCALVPNTPAVAEFCERYGVGVPTYDFEVAEGVVTAAKVLRGAPCGLTDWLRERLEGLPADDTLPERAGHLHHTYPCLATMFLDPATGDTVMHASLYLLRRRVAEALERAKAGARAAERSR